MSNSTSNVDQGESGRLQQMPMWIAIIAPTPFDRQGAAAILRPHFETADIVEIDPSQSLQSNHPPAIRIAFWNSADTQLLDRFQLHSGNGASTPLLIVVERASQALAPLRNVSLMGVYAKTDGIAKFVEAVRSVLSGGTYFSDGVQLDANEDSVCAALSALSRRERELLPLLAEGLPLREAASRLGIGYKTADAHRTALFRKLGVHDRVELVRLAIRKGFARA
ncbi:MAG: response regulator transcription factor [Phycisphaerales bacterium]|nr:response regulator transcription factor [Phycisphaerales bacterium]